jgi:ribosome-interacting GTPase 1
MPTNLPPDYYEVEKQYRAASSPEEKAAYLEEMLSIVPKHKGTDHLRAELRRKLSKLKASAQSSKKGGSRRESAFRIEREGAGQVAIVGLANVGKSSLVDALTNATPEISPAPYTTWTPTPGMMEMEKVQIQLIDTPPLNPDFIEPLLMDLIRRCDLILLMVDLQTDPIQQLEDSLKILLAHRVIPMHLKAAYEENHRLAFKPLLVLANKNDDETSDENFEIFRALCTGECTALPISVKTRRNLDEMQRMIYDRLEIVRVYSKAPGEEPDFNAPFVCKRGTTVEEFAARIHKDFADNLKAARVWGEGVFDGQMVSRDYTLQEGDVIELQA